MRKLFSKLYFTIAAMLLVKSAEKDIETFVELWEHLKVEMLKVGVE